MQYLSEEINGVTIVYPDCMTLQEAYGYAVRMKGKYGDNVYGVSIFLDGDDVTLQMGMKVSLTEKIKRASTELIESIGTMFLDMAKEKGHGNQANQA